MRKEIIDEGITIHLETEPLTKDGRDWCINEFGNKGDEWKEEFYFDYLDYVLTYAEVILEKNFKVVIDTAHVYACGITTEKMCEMFKTFSEKNMMEFCHFNGNTQPTLKPDHHTAMFKSDNKIKNWEKLVSTVKEIPNLILIAENGANGADESLWKEFAAENNFQFPKDEELRNAC